jgi:predicted MPP superfamily phosphohydrolase
MPVKLPARMNIIAALMVLLLTFSLAPPKVAEGQRSAEAALSDTLLTRLPREMRGPAKKLLRLLAGSEQHLLALSDDDLRAAIVGRLSLKPEASDYLIRLLAEDLSPKVRLAIITNWGTSEHWRTNPRAQPLLERLVTTDRDASVSLRALEILRSTRTSELSRLLNTRLEAARLSGDETALKKFAAERERWISLKQGVMLPSFLRVVPKLFSLKPADQSVRVLAFGDFGIGSAEQKQVAQMMLAFHRQFAFDLGVTLGDNFYPRGMTSPTDERWKTQWEELYSTLGIKFYAVLGNHDWYGPDSPAAEILYSDKSSTWRMPAPYYTFTAGPVQFFALDTNEISEAQILWLREELSKSQSMWKVVYGHHPIYSAGAHGETKDLIVRLLPLLQEGKVDVYLSGHDHNLQHLKLEGGVQFFVSGGGGADTYRTDPYERALFVKEGYGFTVIEADKKEMKVRFIDKNGNQLYEYTLQK